MILTMRSSRALLDRFEYINEFLGSDVPRSTVLNNALQYISKSDENTIFFEAYRFKVKNYERSRMPANIKIEVDDDLFSMVVEKIKDYFQLQKVQYPYVCKLVLSAYIIFLMKGDQSKNKNITLLSKQISIDKFKSLEINEKLDVIYELLIAGKYDHDNECQWYIDLKFYK